MFSSSRIGDKENSVDVLPKISYRQCGFSSIEGNVVSVFASYFDESGTHNKQFLVIAGYTAEVDRWVDFSGEWNSLLARNSISHIHMKAFRQRGSKPFLHLSANERRNLLAALLDIIKKATLFGTFSIISPQVYDSLRVLNIEVTLAQRLGFAVLALRRFLWRKFKSFVQAITG